MKILISIKKSNSFSTELNIKNSDTNLTEKIIEKNITIHNLKYKINLTKIGKLYEIIKTNFIPIYVTSNQTISSLIPFQFDDLTITLDDLDQSFLYKVKVELIEQFYGNEIIHDYSQHLFFNTTKGLITKEKIEEMNKKLHVKKIYCQSEKDVIKNVRNEIEYQNLNEFVTNKDIKSFTLQNRNFDGINNFVNKNEKFSKLNTEDRKKKVIYGMNTKMFFEEKIKKNNIKDEKNPFLKNKWFMGPIYSYDNNYKKLI